MKPSRLSFALTRRSSWYPMNPGGFRSMSVTMLLLFASVAIMAASATRLQVTTPRELTIAIVDAQRTTPERNQLRAAVAATVQTILAETLGAEVPVRPVYVGGRDAKVKLLEGAYDAALVIGEDRPFSLRRMDLLTLAGEMPSEYGPLPISLVLGRNDPTLAQHLRTAFIRLVTPTTNPVVTAPTPSAHFAQIGG